jgi:hypothetical protein
MLEGRDSLETKKLLTAATDLLLPHPRDIESSPTVDALLAEVRTQVKVSPSDNSSEARAAILNFLAQQFADYLLATRKPAIRARLGASGELPASLYRLTFPDSFRQAAKRGIRRSHVENAVFSPDAVEHLLPEKLQQAGSPAASIYGKILGEPSSRNQYTLLVITQRNQDVQAYGSAWRVYHSDVDVSKATTLIDRLRAFVDVYGLEISVGGIRSTEKLILYRSFQATKDSKPTQLVQIHSDTTPLPRFEMHHFLKVTSPGGLVEVAIAFAIDLTRYEQDLERHGVTVER